MLLIDIYETAASLISEEADGADNADLKAKSPHLISLITSELVPLEKALYDEDIQINIKFESLNEEFPLCDELALICAYKLAYLLIADENTPLYQVLKTEYELCRSRFVKNLKAHKHKIINVYP